MRLDGKLDLFADVWQRDHRWLIALYDLDRDFYGRKYPALVRAESTSGAPAPQIPQGEYVLSLRELLQVMRRRLWLIVLTALTLTGLAIGYSFVAYVPEYEASIKVLIRPEPQRNAPPPGDGGEVQGLQDVTLTMAEAVDTRSVAEGVIQRLDLSMTPGDLVNGLTVQQVPDTQFLQISYRDTDPERAQEVANSIGDVFAEKVSEVSPSVVATVWERAVTPTDPVSPKPLRIGLLALLVGAMLGVGLAFLAEHLDDSWRSPEEVEQVSGVPTLGVIPEFRTYR